MMCLTKLMAYYNLNCIYRILNIIIIIQYLLNKGQDLHQGWYSALLDLFGSILVQLCNRVQCCSCSDDFRLSSSHDFFCIYFILNNKAYLISIKSICEVY